MAGYIRLCDKNPDAHSDVRTRSKILRAKLAQAVGGKPDQAQAMMIRALVPVYLDLERMREDFENGAPLPADYCRLHEILRTSLSQLRASCGSVRGRKSVRPESVLDLEAALESA